jgi:putative DNA primase/helicase
VSTSETNEGTLYNEDLLKRLTGRDKVTSRELYQQNQEWVPVCTLWLATNHLPRFSTDDDAIWRRLKLVPFTTVLVDEPDHEDDFSRTHLVPEKDGILNWLLQGLREFLDYGLGEPPAVKEAAQGQRLQSDPVSQFLEDRLEEGVLIRAEGYTMKLTELYSMYVEWARQVGERAVGSRRFNQRLANGSSGLSMTKHGQQMFWDGLGRAAAASLLGTMITSGWGPPDPG